MTYRLRLLGRFGMTAPSGAAIEIGAKKSQALIAILALAGGTPVPRSRLTAVLWGDRGEEQARSSLRQALTALRKTFAAHGDFPLAVTEDSAAIDPARLSADIAALNGGAGEILAPGEFLEGLHIPGQPAEDWLRAERARFARLLAERLSARLAAAEATGDPAAAKALRNSPIMA